VRSTITVDDSRFRSQMARYVDELGLQARDVITTQTRLLLKQVIGFTPPKTLAQGRKAVLRDLTRAVSPIDGNAFAARFKNPRTQARVLELCESGNIEDLQALLNRVPGFGSTQIHHFSPLLHTGARDARGHVRKRRNVATLDVRSWNRYLSQTQKHVGRMKAAWGPAYVLAGGTLPSWVARQSDVPGGIIENRLHDRNKPSLTFVSRAPGVGQLRDPFSRALRTRAEAMFRDIRLRLGRIAKKSGFQ
jgi:hypothetical protein